MLSVLIPARDEIYLKKTIESTLAASRGEIEIIAILDGYWPNPPIEDDPRVTLIHNTQAVGQRPAVNQAARIAKGKYILKTDGHSMFDEGFDVKLAADCKPDWTVIPRMYTLDVEKWKPKMHKRGIDFMWINSPEKGLQDKPFRALFFDGKMARKYPECYRAYKENSMYRGDICDVMTANGACWFMYKDRFWELEGMDEAHGQWGQVGVEVALKAWLSGGKLIVNKKTWFAHYFRGGGIGFPWPASGRKQEAARKYSREFWMSNKWPLQIPGRDVMWLVKKFAPLPNWKGNGSIISIPIEKKDPAKPPKMENVKPKVATDLTLLYYTANTSTFRDVVEDRLKSFDYPIVSISQEPIDLGTNICVGKIGRSLQNIYKQVLEGAKKAITKYVALVEDDCLYIPEHFEYRPTENCFAYNLSRWLLHPSGVYSYRERPVLSQCIAPRELLVECLEERFKLSKIPKKYCGEVGLFERKLGIKEFPYETFKTKDPNVVICHRSDTSGRKYYGKDAECRGDLYPWGGGNALRYSLTSTEEVMSKGKEAVIKYGRSGKIHSQHSIISSAILDVEMMCKHRMDWCDRRKPAQLQRFLNCFPPFLDKVVEMKGEITDEMLETDPVFKPYYDYMVDHLNPLDRVPVVSGKGRRHVLHQLREVYTLYIDIRDNGLKAPLDIWRSKNQTIMTLHRGGRRLEILKKLGIKKVAARTFKTKQAFRAHNPKREWSLGPIEKDSIHNLAIDQFTRLGHRATDKYWVHNYTRLYDRYLSHLRDKPIKLLEIGVFRGASLLLWRDAFPKALIYGVDKLTNMWKRYIKGQKRIQVFVGHQEDVKFLNDKVVPAGPFDVIIDDGGHHPEQQLATFGALWPHLTEGGIYVLEDLQGNYWKKHAKKGPLMMEELKRKLDEICTPENSTLSIRSLCLHYNICFIEKIF